MSDEKNKIENTKQQAKKASRFAMTEDDDLLAEDEDHDHVHVEGCCSCHSNIGK